MITNKDIRVENGNLVLNGDKFPLDGQSPETIMEIVEDNSDSTPTENSTVPITSGGVYTALGTKQDTLTFDSAPTDASTNPVTSGGVYTAIGAVDTKIGDLTQTGVTGATVAAQIETVGDQIKGLTANTLTGIDISAYNSPSNKYIAPTDGYVRFELRNENHYFYLNVNDATLLGGEGHQVTNANDYMCAFIRKGMNIYYSGTVQTANFFSFT